MVGGVTTARNQRAKNQSNGERGRPAVTASEKPKLQEPLGERAAAQTTKLNLTRKKYRNVPHLTSLYLLAVHRSPPPLHSQIERHERRGIHPTPQARCPTMPRRRPRGVAKRMDAAIDHFTPTARPTSGASSTSCSRCMGRCPLLFPPFPHV